MILIILTNYPPICNINFALHALSLQAAESGLHMRKAAAALQSERGGTATGSVPKNSFSAIASSAALTDMGVYS